MYAAKASHSALTAQHRSRPLFSGVQGLHPFLCSVPDSRWTNLPRSQSPGPPALTLIGDNQGTEADVTVIVDAASGTSRWLLPMAGSAEARLHRSVPKRGPERAEPEAPRGAGSSLSSGTLTQRMSVIDSDGILETEKRVLMVSFL